MRTISEDRARLGVGVVAAYRARYLARDRSDVDVYAVRRAHVHVQHADGEAKFWIEPTVELAANFSLKPKQVTEVQKLIEEHLNEIRSAWAKHFPGGSQ